MRHWIASLLELCNKDHRAWGGFWYIEATVALNFAFFSLDQFSESIAFLRRYAGFVRARTFLQIAEADKDHAAWLDKHHVAFCGACHSCLWWTCRLAALCAGLWGIAVMFTDPSPSVIYFYMLVPVFGYLVAALIGALGFTGLCYYLKWTADTDVTPVSPEGLQENFRKSGATKKGSKPAKNHQSTKGPRTED